MTNPLSRIQSAVAFAARAHDGQYRKDGATPYVSHVMRVCLVAIRVFGIQDEDMIIAALLHDSIEDTTTDYDDVVEQFGERVAKMVAALSKDKRLADHTREEAYMATLCLPDPAVQILKLADIYDNLCDFAALPVERRRHSLYRARTYLDRMKSHLASEAKPAYAIVRGLFDSVAADLPS